MDDVRFPIERLPLGSIMCFLTRLQGNQCFRSIGRSDGNVRIILKSDGVNPLRAKMILDLVRGFPDMSEVYDRGYQGNESSRGHEMGLEGASRNLCGVDPAPLETPARFAC